MYLFKIVLFFSFVALSLNTGASAVCDEWAGNGLKEIKKGSTLAYYDSNGKVVEKRFKRDGYHVVIIGKSTLLPGDKTACFATISDPTGNVDKTITLLMHRYTKAALKDPEIKPAIQALGELNGKNEKQNILKSPTSVYCKPTIDNEPVISTGETPTPTFRPTIDDEDVIRTGETPVPIFNPDRPPEEVIAEEKEEVEDFSSEGFQGLGKGFAPECKAFIKDDGTYGEFGNIIGKYINEAGDKSPLLNNNITDMKTTCPNWKKFTKEQKTHFWTHTFASIAMDESSCNPKARNAHGSDGVAAGLLQMPERKSGPTGHYWRGPNCKKATDMYDPNDNIKCSLDIMSELMEGKEGVYKNRGGIFGRKNTSYWEKLKRKDSPKKSRIIKLMLGYKACGY